MACRARVPEQPTFTCPAQEMAATVIEALRRFLPGFLSTKPSSSPAQRRAIWAILHCRTAAMGGRLFACAACGHTHYAYHSCNHKACPQCGRAATARWVKRELGKLVGAPYFMVTFTLPANCANCFFGPHAKEAYDLFFAAVSGALAEKLADGKGLHAPINGFTGRPPHLEPAAALPSPHPLSWCPALDIRSNGKVVTVKNANFLVHLSPSARGLPRALPKLLPSTTGRSIPPSGARTGASISSPLAPARRPQIPRRLRLPHRHRR